MLALNSMDEFRGYKSLPFYCQQDDFIKNGGFRENLLKKRLEFRNNVRIK
ncbi:MAG: hypothetical protein M1484_03880 [Patescibacteria group bacterium]|nr:hypothetical protein [Patescibacteria group bacterium]MCL5432201.1 hypothetical protein [Patescibacteria group bacterium]